MRMAVLLGIALAIAAAGALIESDPLPLRPILSPEHHFKPDDLWQVICVDMPTDHKCVTVREIWAWLEARDSGGL